SDLDLLRIRRFRRGAFKGGDRLIRLAERFEQETPRVPQFRIVGLLREATVVEQAERRRAFRRERVSDVLLHFLFVEGRAAFDASGRECGRDALAQRTFVFRLRDRFFRLLGRRVVKQVERRDHLPGGDRADLRDPRQLVFLGPGNLPGGIVTTVDQCSRARRVKTEDLEEVCQGAAIDLAFDLPSGPPDGDRADFHSRLGGGRLRQLTFRPSGRGELGAGLITDELPRIGRPAFRARSGPAKGSDVPKDRDGATALAQDEGEILDGKTNGTPIVPTQRETNVRLTPQTLIVGVATFGGYIPREYRTILREAIENGLDIVAGLHEYLSQDPEFATLAESHRVRLVDVRRPRPIRESKQFSDLSRKLPCLRIPVLGTDGAIGKRTTALLLTDALN